MGINEWKKKVKAQSGQGCFKQEETEATELSVASVISC